MAEYTIVQLNKEFEKIYKELEKNACCCKNTTGKNLGLGEPIFAYKYKTFLNFKSLKAGSNVTLSSDDESITISASGGGGSFTCSDLNSCDTDSLPEGATNLYFTNSRAISALTGQNISIFTNDVPYLTSASLTGYVQNSRTLTINGTSYDLSADRTWSVGTVTSVGATAGTGISIAGSPITSSGSFTITNTAPDQTVVLTNGTGIAVTGTYPNFTITNTAPATTSGTVTSFSSGDLSPLFTTSVANSTTTPALSFSLSNAAANTWYGNNTGGSTTPSFNSAGSLSESTSSILTITGSNTLLGNTTIQVGQATTSTSGYLSSTDWNTFNNKGSGTVTSVAALTLGTTGTDLSSSVATGTTTPVITLNVPTASASNRGVLSAADWTTFNNKGSGTVTSIGLTTGTTGTDVNVSGSPVTGSGTITLNIPDASASNRGLITNGSQTIAGAKTFSTGIKMSALTASEILALDGSNNMQTLTTATYPSLTELSYVKGVTSAIQTQIGTKLTASNNLSDVSNAMTAVTNLGLITLKLSGNVTTSSNVAGSITGMSFSAAATAVYKIEGFYHIGCDNTGGVVFAVTLPASATVFLYCFGNSSSATAFLSTTIAASATLTGTAHCTQNNALRGVHINGTITTAGTSGTVQFQFASGTNTQTSTIYQEGSWINVERIT